MPIDGHWATVADFVRDRTGDAAGVRPRLETGEVVLGDGTVVGPDTAYRPGQWVFLHRDLPDELPVPGELSVLHQDERIVVVDKPHFLATMPRGRHVTQTVVVRLRRDLDLPELSPAHRLDRLTAGVLVLTTRREYRAAYQQLFATRVVGKEYLAVAPAPEGFDPPARVASRIVKERGVLQARQVPGEANAITDIELLERRDTTSGPLGLYRLSPVTGRTHQLRVHLAGLGIAILGDPLYPDVRDVAADDFTDPLQLLAHRLRFTDPITGTPHEFVSRRRLVLTVPVGPADAGRSAASPERPVEGRPGRSRGAARSR